MRFEPPLRERLRYAGAAGASVGITDDRTVMARTFAYLFGIGALLLLATLLLPGSGDRSVAAMGAIALVALAVAAACVVGYDRLSLWFFRALPLVGNVCIAGVLLVSGAEATPAYALFFFWVAVSAFYFFDVAYATLCGGLSSGLYALLLHLHPEVPLGPLSWVMLTGTMFVIAVLVGRLRSRAEGLVEQLGVAARTDVLTGLINRREFELRLDGAVTAAQDGGGMALVLLDVDRFKQINDRHGHHAGDRVLRRVAETLAGIVRDGDTLARLGGDEFALIAPGSDQPEAYLLVERLREAVARVFEDDPHPTTLSAGIALFGEHGSSADALTEAADQALYAAKRLGRDCAVIYSHEVARSLADLGLDAPDRELPTTLEAIISLTEVVDVRQLGSSQHSQAVGRHAERIACKLGLSRERAQRVRLAGILHDVGKIAVPGGILAKRGRLSADEVESVRRHPEIGAQIARNARLADIADWIGAHHERPDGRGYPLGLRGDDIPLEARILSVADAYEAMTAGRGDRRPMGLPEAVAELRAHAGTQFDPRVVEVLIEALQGDAIPSPPVPGPVRSAAPLRAAQVRAPSSSASATK